MMEAMGPCSLKTMAAGTKHKRKYKKRINKNVIVMRIAERDAAIKTDKATSATLSNNIKIML
ncbi:hypothetical protein [Candidatus Avelusimicrobium fimicolum]|uniref:hypothetical protein n=1 Tax=Candidatus Avelusimicrobium fimicolum TaxID=3416216 RepID=UPI003D13879D